MHEMGHLLGLNHLEKGLMVPKYLWGRNMKCIDKRTMEEIGKLYGISSFNYCEE